MKYKLLLPLALFILLISCKGKKSEWSAAYKKLLTRSEMNLKGNVKSIRDNTYKVDSLFGQLRKLSKDVTGNEYFEFDTAGRKLKGAVYTPDDIASSRSEANINEQGNKEDNFYTGDQSTTTERNIYLCLDNGVIIEKDILRPEKESKLTMTGKEISNYDEKGNLISIDVYGFKDLSYKQNIKTDGKGNILEDETRSDKGDNLLGKKIFKYDENGNPIEADESSPVDNTHTHWTFKYEFDTHGNWIKKYTTMINMPLVENTLTERTIVYY